MLSFLIFALIYDTAAIRTTVADSSRVAFIAQTPVTWETVEHHNLHYIQFTDSPLMDSIGYPELPMITCLVAFPDNVTPELEFTFSDVREVTVDPVYPAPAMIISTEFTPSVVDSDEDCSDSWRGNNSCVQTIQLNDTYPVDSEWLVDNRPLAAPGVVNTTPLLVNLDTDTELEVVVLAGNTLAAFEDDGTPIWELSSEGFGGGGHPLAADLDQDGETELLIASSDNEIKIISNLGRVLYTLTGASNVYAVGNLHSRTGLELCTASADGRYLKLYYWENNSMNLIATKDFVYTGLRSPVSLVVAGVTGSTYDDAVYLNGGGPAIYPPQEEKTSFEIYNWGSSSHEYSDTWKEYVNHGIRLSAGMLSGIGSVGYPQGVFDTTGDPAMLIEPDEISPEISCVKTSVLSSTKLNWGVFADWAEFPGGPDAFILPSERQCMAWNVLGQSLTDFPTTEFDGASEGSFLSPTALGNLNGTGDDDVLFSTSLDGDWTLIGLDSDGDPLSTTLDFPYTLPEGVTATGGFAIADLDRDGKVEIVFGTDDGLLHCWEFGSCATGYAPWTQFQHDSGRSGVLE